MMNEPTETIDLATKIKSPPYTWKRFFKKVLYWIFPPTLIWGALTFIANKLLGGLLGRTLMKQPKATGHHDSNEIYENIRSQKAKVSEDETEASCPHRQFYTIEEARAQAVHIDVMQFGKKALSYQAEDPEQNPYKAVQVKNIKLKVNEKSTLDTYICEYQPNGASEADLELEPCNNERKLNANRDKKVMIWCPGRARSALFWLPNRVRDTLFYSDPKKILKNCIPPNSKLLNVTFDYRGIKNSVGQITSENDVVEDTMSVVFYLLSEGFSLENIFLHGHSLGGTCVIAADKIYDLLTHLDEPDYQPYFRRLFGQEHLTDREFASFRRRADLHGLFVRVAATRSFGNLPWTIANSLRVSLSLKGYPGLGKLCTWLAAPFLAIFGKLTKFNFDIASSFLRLRKKIGEFGPNFVVHKDFREGDQTVFYPSSLGTMVKNVWVEKIHGLFDRFLRWLSQFRSHQFGSHHYYTLHKTLRTLGNYIDYRNDMSQALSVNHELTIKNAHEVHDKASEDVMVQGHNQSLTQWLCGDCILEWQEATHAYCDQRKTELGLLGEGGNTHSCVILESDGRALVKLLLTEPELGIAKEFRQQIMELFVWVTIHQKNLSQGTQESVLLELTREWIYRAQHGQPVPPAQDQASIALPRGRSRGNSLIALQREASLEPALSRVNSFELEQQPSQGSTESLRSPIFSPTKPGMIGYFESQINKELNKEQRMDNSKCTGDLSSQRGGSSSGGGVISPVKNHLMSPTRMFSPSKGIIASPLGVESLTLPIEGRRRSKSNASALRPNAPALGSLIRS